MLKTPVYNQKGEEVETTLLSKEIFEVAVNPDLVYQIVTSQMANRRKRIAHTKGRGEVSGGGKKPWRQKGTGRARVGSNRSPLWRGGGITFGPTKERVFKKKLNKKMQRKALFMILSSKVKNGLTLFFDKINIEKPKTKILAEIIKNWKLKTKIFSKKGSCLIVLDELKKDVILATKNLSGIKTIQAKDLNALDLLSFKYLIMAKGSLKVIKETFLK